MTIETENERAFLCGKNGWMKYFKTDKSRTSMTKGPFSTVLCALKELLFGYFGYALLSLLDTKIC